ncbi:MAG: hypothetical protein ACK48V_02105 [Crocinitomicaceae bacterium]|jgi:hypothetical protein
MKKLTSILGILIVNVVLAYIVLMTFNPFHLVYSEIAWFSGFDWSNLFSPSVEQNILLFSCVFGFVYLNITLIKVLKEK